MAHLGDFRIIPVVQTLDESAIKTCQFQATSYVGCPINTVRILSDFCADEIILLDLGASAGSYPVNYGFVEAVVSEALVPIAYGGGIRDFLMANRLFELGIERVVLGWRGIQTSELINEIARHWGSQAISVSLDIAESPILVRKLDRLRSEAVFSRSSISDNIRLIQTAGCGEVILQSIDRDGRRCGFSHQLITEALDDCNIQLVALGGCKGIADMADAIKAGASAVASGSQFVFHEDYKSVLVNYPTLDDRQSILIS
jgi:cyclase